MNDHAFLSCSGAHRWIACPGSARLEAQFPRTESPYAAEGTTAHALLESALLLGDSSAEASVELVEGATAEMAETLQPVIDWISGWLAEHPGAELFLERKVNPGQALGREDLWGTADVLGIAREQGELLIGDLKYGAGRAVEVEGNVQLQLYALGALVLAGPEIERVTLAILQPRAVHAAGPVRVTTLSRADLEAFGEEIKAAAAQTEQPDAPLIAGEHCTFCRASGGCSALAELSLALAREMFLAVDQPLSPERIGRLLQQADTLRSWLKALEAEALRLAREGTPIPGFKLANRRGHRAWINPEAALARLSETYAVDSDLLAPRALISPAQVEKVVKRETKQKVDLSELVRVPELGPRLVPDGTPGGDAFEEALELFEGLEL
jgi:hypothetical protein